MKKFITYTLIAFISVSAYAGVFARTVHAADGSTQPSARARAAAARAAAQNGTPFSTASSGTASNGSTGSLGTPATGPFEISGWIPYWSIASGTADTLAHLSELTEINPFGYSVKSDGTLRDTLNVNNSAWQTLFKAARAKGVRIIPTVMWSDTGAIDNVLSNPTLRAAHVKAVVAMVNQNNFAGVDIDYEGKKASDIQYFSSFLQELKAALGTNKQLDCTIEARAPPDSLYKTIPANIAYANDFVAINKYCDRVRLMTYDQETADIKLNASATGLYTPVADPAWVTKVITLAAQNIDKNKLVMGVATYGYDYQIMPSTTGNSSSYTLIQSFDPKYATDIARQYGITPARNSAGELSFTYVPKSLPAPLPTNSLLSSLAPRGTLSANLVAAGAVALAKTKAQQAPFHLLWWSDAQAVADKVALAKKLGLRGVAIFKFDGGEDPNMWNLLNGAKGK